MPRLPRFILLATCCLGWLAPFTPVAARPAKDADKDKIIEIGVGSSQAIRVPFSIERVVVGDPTICDVMSLPTSQLLLTAKAAGETQITASARDGNLAIFRVVASLPVAGLQQALREAFPAEEDLQVHAAGSAVYLSGTVTDAITAEAAEHLATSLYAGTSRKAVDVVNLLTIGNLQQVQVKLRFVEVSRTALREMGFSAWGQNTQMAGGAITPGASGEITSRATSPLAFSGPTPTGAAAALPMLSGPRGDAFNLMFAYARLPISATLSVLQQHGVAKTLSEPTLVAMSGQKAQFLVGGEFPVPVPDALGKTNIQFKSYGVALNFVPTVLAHDTVNLMLESTVSDLDKQTQVNVGGNTVYGLKTRQGSTSVRLRDGQSFAIAGLLQDKIDSANSRVPLLGDIPLLGMFFRSVLYQRQETELVVLVQVHLVKPLEANQVPDSMTEDEFSDPNDLQLFLLGIDDRTRSRESNAASGKHVALEPSAPGGVVGFIR